LASNWLYKGFAAFFARTFVGAGVGYAYEFDFVRNIVRLELGGAVGWFSLIYEESGGGTGMTSTFFLVLRPTLHVGYKYFYVSLGPRLAIGESVAGGFTAGFLIRI
jgi:hypothetical protein